MKWAVWGHRELEPYPKDLHSGEWIFKVSLLRRVHIQRIYIIKGVHPKKRLWSWNCKIRYVDKQEERHLHGYCLEVITPRDSMFRSVHFKGTNVRDIPHFEVHANVFFLRRVALIEEIKNQNNPFSWWLMLTRGMVSMACWNIVRQVYAQVFHAQKSTYSGNIHNQWITCSKAAKIMIVYNKRIHD